MSPWFAIYVKSRHEKAVATSFAAKGITTFLPTYGKVYKKGERAEIPVFPGYVFCRLDVQNTSPVVTTPGVFFIVSNGVYPAPIPDCEIEGIRRMVEAKLAIQPWPYVPESRSVTIRSGPLRGLNGIVQDVHNRKWLVISVQLLQQAVAVKLDPAYI